MHFHWQNLNEGRTGADGKTPLGLPWHGRAWLYLASKFALHLEWHLWRWSCGASVSVDDELKLHLAIPPASFWFSVEAPIFSRRYGEGRELRLNVHDWAVWWNLWTDTSGWSSKTPWYRNGCLHIDDLFLGKVTYSTRKLDECEVEVPMPERCYRGRAVLEEATWKRPRWFAKKLVRVNIEMLKGEQVPFPGKGENSWDCGEDAAYGFGGPARSIEAGVAMMVESVLMSRRRHGGRGWRPETKAA